MATAIRAIKMSRFGTSASILLEECNKPGFFSLKWAAIDVCIIAALVINHIK